VPPMGKQQAKRMVRLLAGVATLTSVAASPALAGDSASRTAPGPAAATTVGGALPGGAIISARFAQLTSALGGDPIVVPIATDGSFRFEKQKPGHYRFAVMSTPKQTQGTTFGEKVNSGLAQTGGALATGAAVSQPAAPAGPAPAARLPDSTPARISTNFTIGKQTGRLTVDGPGVDVEVSADGLLSGHVSAATSN
jgi:hypothetical protein